MADVRLKIAGRDYIVTCRDGEEERLSSLGAMVEDMVEEAGGSAGGLNESRQLLFASLLLADKLKDLDKNSGKADASAIVQPHIADDKQMKQAAETLNRLAERLESLADKLEN